MKFLLQTAAIFFTGYVLALFTPWYGVAVAAFAMGYALRTQVSFLAGFAGVGLLWLWKAWMIDTDASVDFAATVARILSLPGKTHLSLATALLGGLVGGFAALAGSLLRPGRKKNPYSQ